jgi:hypothetical protein
MPANSGRPVGDPIVVVVVDVVVVDVVVVEVAVVVEDVADAVVGAEVDTSGAALSEDEHPAVARINAIRPIRLRRIGSS